MIDFELEPEHESIRQSIVQSWDEEKRQERDSMPVAEMLKCFEACYWVEERAFQNNRKNHERRRQQRRLKNAP
jgi:hypothetical protein